VSNWGAPGVLFGKTARDCTREEIFAEVWHQMKESLNEDGIILRDGDVVDRFLDPAITFGPDGTPVDNAEQLLINTVDSWAKRPDAVTKIPNLFLASDYVKTNTDLATMEGANEAARRAVNGVLDLTGWSGARARIWTIPEPPLFAFARAEDGFRYALGLPHKLSDRR
jgi:15-cis-phytoene desaturase